MPAKSVITDFQGASYEGVDFAKYVTEWKDTREQGNVYHQYIKRSGAEAENVGRPPHQTQVTLAFVGPKWRSSALQLIAKFDEKPIGLLTHPVHGNMRVGVDGYRDAAMNVQDALDMYILPVRFTESSVDTKVQGGDSQGPTARQQGVTSKSASLAGLSTTFATAASLIAQLTSSAVSYASSAVNSALSGTPDPSLTSQLATVGVLAQATITAIRSDPAATSDATAYDAVALCEGIHDDCAQLDDAVRSAKPRLFKYVVPMTTHITNLARNFYGKDGAAREAEILLNNAGKIPDPGAIASGTELSMAPPTV